MAINLLLGIIGGIVAAPLTLALQQFWFKVITPWFEERIYQDAHIEGKWKGTIKYGDNEGETLLFDIRRQSHRITGTMLSQEDGKIFEIVGDFRNMIMTITYVSQNKQTVDRGGFTFLLIKNGQELQGHGAFYYNPDHKITTASITLTRVTD